LWHINFHLDLSKKSMKSCKVRSVRCWILKITTFATTHNIAPCLLGGHILNWGRSTESCGVRDGIVRNFLASRFIVYCHIVRASPQAINLCSKVSVAVHLRQVSEGTILIPGSRTLVGIMSCMMRYHRHLVFSGTGASFMGFHMQTKSIMGQSF